ncbi:MAG: sulfatase-like hydrolase/transferase [Planctomycetota bacterium]
MRSLNRRNFLKTAALATGAVSLSSCAIAQTSKPPQEKPNILWIYIEDMSPWIGCYGDTVNKDATPTIDALAADGVRFSRCYVPAPVCSPCRSALITGAYQTTTGLHNHRSSRSKASAIYLPEGVTTLPQLFQKAGYQTFNAGKDDYNFAYKREELYDKATRETNFAVWRTLDKDKPFFGQIQLKGGKSKTESLKNKVAPDLMMPPPYFPNTEIFRKHKAHHYDTVRQTESDTRIILNNLKADGLLDKTVIVWFTDHGDNYSLRAKQFCTEIGTHVPMIITGPHAALKAGTVRDDLVSALDISATSLALAGIAIPDYFESRDLFAKNFKPRNCVISARDRCDYTIDRIRAVRTENFRYIRNFLTDRPLLQPQYRDSRADAKALRKGHAKGTLPELTEQIFFGPRPAEELYDHRSDPHEINNLAKDPKFKKELRRHRKILDDWIKKTDDKGQYPESAAGLRDVFNQWKNKCVNPEYDRLRNK